MINSIAHDVDRLYKHSLNGGTCGGHTAEIHMDFSTGTRRVTLPYLDVSCRLDKPAVTFHQGNEAALFNYSAQMDR